MLQFTFRIDREDPAGFNRHGPVRQRVREAISETSVKGIVSCGEERLNILQTGNLEVLRPLNDDFSMERVQQRSWVQQDWSIGQR